jgi:hypothetical protein
VSRRVCVFCGSKDGERPAYRSMATRAGRAIAQAGCELVYGGSARGLMGAVADAALEGGARVVGVLPQGLLTGEGAHPGLTERCVVASMHERKALMYERASVFLALPGGFGTMDELFEALTWGQLGVHQKPVGLLDIDGFYQPLLTWIAHAVREGFASRAAAEALEVDSEPERLLGRLLATVCSGNSDTYS